MIPKFSQIDPNLCNDFLREFSGHQNASLTNLKGNINNTVKDIFLNNFYNQDAFRTEIERQVGLPSLREKALNLHDKYAKIYQFKTAVGGTQFYGSRVTQDLANIYNCYLNQVVDKETALAQISQIKAPRQTIQQAMGFIDPPKPAMAEPAAATGAQPVKLDEAGIKALYGQKKVARAQTDFQPMVDAGGAANVGATIYTANPKAKIGIMIAGNHGVLGGALGKGDKVGRIKEEDLKMKTQEESIWANAVLTKVGTNSEQQTAYYNDSLAGKWGMKSMDGISTETIQGIDYTKTQDAKDYNLSLNLQECFLSRVDDQKRLTQEKYPVTFSFTAGPNANPAIGTPQGTMQRTLNRHAVEDYNFFCSCIKEALRSSLDGMAAAGVTHPLVAPLSCGIYAGKHQKQIIQDYPHILNEVLNEAVGPKGEKRGQYFEQVIFPKLS